VYRMQKRPAEAEAQFRLALERAPGTPEALAELVGLTLGRNDPQGAIRLLEAQLEKAERKAPIHHLLGTVHARMNDSAAAEVQFQKALDLDKNLMGAYVSLGQLYARQKNPDKVIAQYRKMAEAAPTLATPHMLLGVAYEQQQKYDDAVAAYQHALKLDPRLAPAANNLAWLYVDRGGNIDVALNLAQTAVEQLPQDPNVADTLGWIYYKKGAYLKAIALLKESSEKLPQSATVRYHLGMAYEKNGDKESAKRELGKALELDPSFKGADEARQALKASKTG